MLDLQDLAGQRVFVPETIAEDRAYFTPDRLAEAAEYFDENGYVVIRGLLSTALCDRIKASFDASMRDSRMPVLRQHNQRYERNRIDADGFLANPILNVQDLQSGRVDAFKTAALDALTNEAVKAITSSFLGERTRLVQSMYFEAPAGTPAHQDSYYIDSGTEIGASVAGWFALEDVDAGAGRFYVYPRTHSDLDILRNADDLNIGTGHERYRAAVVEAVGRQGFACHAPCLAKGDVLFWRSTTVHGSFGAARPGVSRRSLTAHYLRESDSLLQFHSRLRTQDTTSYNGMTLGMLHSQDKLKNRLIRTVAYRMPGAFGLARKLALKAVVAMRGERSENAFPGTRDEVVRAAE